MSFSNALKRAGIAISIVLLAITALWMYGETQWRKWAPASPPQAFAHATIGLETFPLKYALVLEQVSGAAFRTGLEDGRSLWQTYGFLDNPRADKSKPACVANALDQLPVGFEVSNYVPVTAIVTPVEFAGLTCATCHSGEVRLAKDRTTAPIFGMGNPELDIIAWGDGVRGAVLDPDLTATKILDAYNKQCGGPSGLYERSIGRLFDWLFIKLWLDGIRKSISEGVTQYDMPFFGKELKDASSIPAGPSRTRPFRSVVRVALNFPGADNMALSKIPVVFEQAKELRPRSQYDGSIRDPVVRSQIAAYTSGASIEGLAQPPMVHDIRSAAYFTERLGIDAKVPSYRDVFPDKAPDPARVAAGAAVYQRYCNSCHGSRASEDAPWSLAGAGDIHKLSPLSRLGTDPSRIVFRYADKLPLGLWSEFPGAAADLKAQNDGLSAAANKAKADGDFAFQYFWQQQASALDVARRKYRLGHPLYFASEDLRQTDGYINNPIPRAFLRAPYLHNASVPTLRQLINLDERPKRFCRGENVYDRDAIGLVTPAPGADGRCANPREAFLFDTAQAGNHNTGHDYPWPYKGPGWDQKALEDLLEYLKVL